MITSRTNTKEPGSQHNRYRVVHRMSTSDDSLLSASITTGEFSRNDGNNIISIKGRTTGLACYNDCGLSVNNKRHLHRLDTILQCQGQSEWTFWVDDHDWLVIKPPPNASIDYEFALQLIQCHTLTLPIEHGDDCAIDINEYFYFQSDHTTGGGTGAIHLKEGVQIPLGAKSNMCKRYGKGIKFTTQCFDVSEWKQCDSRYVYIPSSIYIRLQGKVGTCNQLNLNLFQVLFALFINATGTANDQQLDEIDVLIEKHW